MAGTAVLAHGPGGGGPRLAPVQGRGADLAVASAISSPAWTAEFGAPEIAIRDALGWIADWGREFGGMGEGLVLTTAHSAKGLEFDHVVVLDDAWQPRQNTDPDEQRRLFYVAMTRARRSLSIIEAQAPHALLGSGDVPDAFLRRRAVVPDAPLEATDRLYRRATARDVHFSFGAWLSERGAVVPCIGGREYRRPRRPCQGRS